MSLAGSKTKPEDMFHSLKIIKEESKTEKTFGEKFFERFRHRMTNQEAVSILENEN